MIVLSVFMSCVAASSPCDSRIVYNPNTNVHKIVHPEHCNVGYYGPNIYVRYIIHF